MATRGERQRLVDVPFVDLGHVHNGSRSAILDAIADLIETGAFTNGEDVRRFEDAFAEYCGVQTCVGLASGLDALRLSLLAAGIAPEDEVIVPANTFVATFEAVRQAGASLVVVDASESDYNVDAAAVEAAVSPRTRVVLPVHLYGQMADVAALLRICRERDLLLIEDACQAHGAVRDGIRAGAAGLTGCFSFYPTKNLGAMGDAGAVVTNDERLAADLRALREHGQHTKHRYDLEGYTSRLDTIQALVLLRKLPDLDAWNGERRAAAARYAELLAGVGDLALPPVPAGSEPVWHVYAVRTSHCDALAEYLAGRGIRTARHYPEPPHLAPAYADLGHRPGSFPVAEALAAELLSLPMFPGITDEQLDAVASAISDYFAGAR